jgi:hypothetical protein
MLAYLILSYTLLIHMRAADVAWYKVVYETPVAPDATLSTTMQEARAAILPYLDGYKALRALRITGERELEMENGHFIFMGYTVSDEGGDGFLAQLHGYSVQGPGGVVYSLANIRPLDRAAFVERSWTTSEGKRRFDDAMAALDSTAAGVDTM